MNNKGLSIKDEGWSKSKETGYKFPDSSVDSTSYFILYTSSFRWPQEAPIMLKRSKFETTQSQIMHRSEDLIGAASNRYRITVQVANRAKRRRYEDFENNEDVIMKPVLRAIIEMSDELTQPEIIGEL